ncbi:MAG: hypothetical protein ABH864_07095 [archaeon]
MEDVALKNAASSYTEREIEHRVKCLSVSRSLQGVQSAASYGMGFEDYKGGGLVLALEIDDGVRKSLPEDWEQMTIIHVPKRLSLRTLRKVHLSPRAVKDVRQIVEEEFELYGPEILRLDGV